MNSAELDAIEKWGADILAAYNRGGSVLANRLCDYTDALPTRSIRSQMLALVAEVRSLLAEQEALIAEQFYCKVCHAAAGERCIANEDGVPCPERVAVSKCASVSGEVVE